MNTLTIPRPITAFWGDGYACDFCGCSWIAWHGEANRVNEWCDSNRCPCHREDFTTAIYEGQVAA